MPISSTLVSRVVADLRPVARWIGRDVSEKRERAQLSLGIPALNAFLHGGLPYGAITEIFGGVSSGRTTLAHMLTSAATRAGEFTAWVDLPNSLDPDCAQRSGANLERVLWVYPVDRVTAFRAVEHVLGAGGFRLVLLDLDGPLQSRSLLPASAWLRLARAAVRRDAAIVVLSASRMAGAFATLSLEACPRRRIFVGESGPCPIFEGATSSLYLRKYRFGPLDTNPVDLFASTRT